MPDDVDERRQAMKTRLQNQNFNLFKIVLNRVLTLPDYRSRLALLISCGIIEKGLICVELRPFYCGKRILVPMSYIVFWERNQGNFEGHLKGNLKVI